MVIVLFQHSVINHFCSLREESEGGTSTPGRGVAARWPPAAESPQQQVTPKQQRGGQQ